MVRMATPKWRGTTHILALRNRIEVNLDLGHCQNVGGGAHVDEEFCAVDVSALILTRLPLSVRPTQSRGRSVRPKRNHSPSPTISCPREADSPWIVDLAPAAEMAPSVPTMKYWNSRLEFCVPLDM